jgi:RNA polymerase sigma-70 factor (ECF subfamily)
VAVTVTQPHASLLVEQAGLVKKLWNRAVAELPVLRGQLTAEVLAGALERSVRSRFGERGAAGGPEPQEVVPYLESLQVADLGLACACAEGNAAAWEHFVLHFRPELYAAARAIGGEANARELADSLYAELYGLEEREGRRRSLFHYFHGRSKLSTWLRAVLAQRHVDAIRAGRRTVSLDGEADADGERIQAQANLRSPAQAKADAALDPDRDRYLALMQAVLTSALRTLEARDRLRLAYYYVQDLTLAQIGRLMGEHEATVSRKLERTRQELKKRVRNALRDEKRLSDAQIEMCYEYAREEWHYDLTEALSARAEE